MKKIIATVLSIGIIATAQAQNEYNSSPYTSKPKSSKGFDPQRLVIGGNLGAGFGSALNNIGQVTTVFSMSISPMVGYSITDNFAAGISLSYQYRSQKNGNVFFNQVNSRQEGYPLRNNVFSPGLWARYTVFDQFFAQVHFEQHFVGHKMYIESYTNPSGKEKLTLNYNLPTLLVSLGYRQPIADRVGMFLSIGYDVLQNSTKKRVYDSQGKPYDVRSPYYNMIMPTVGFGIGF